MPQNRSLRRVGLFVAMLLMALVSLKSSYGQSDSKAESAQKHLELGTIYALKNQLANAKTQFLLALAMDKNNPGALNNLGNILLLEENLDSAITFYQEAAKESPKDGGINLNLGLLYYVSGQDSLAIAELAVALRKIGSMEQAHELLGIQPPSDPLPDTASDSGEANRIQELLEDAARRIPGASPPAGRPPKLVSKRGGVKGSLDSENPEQLLYWKIDSDDTDGQ